MLARGLQGCRRLGRPILRQRTSLFSSIMSTNVSQEKGFSLPLVKIVATIGPSSEQLPTLPEVVQAGMRIMRINFSHATYEEADLRVTNLKSHSTGLHHGGSSFLFIHIVVFLSL
jgi:hypothetical protein